MLSLSSEDYRRNVRVGNSVKPAVAYKSKDLLIHHSLYNGTDVAKNGAQGQNYGVERVLVGCVMPPFWSLEKNFQETFSAIYYLPFRPIEKMWYFLRKSEKRGTGQFERLWSRFSWQAWSIADKRGVSTGHMGQFLSKTIPLCVKPVIASQGWNGQIYAISHMLKFRSCQTCQISTLSPSFSATHQRKHCSRKKSSRTTTIHSAQTYTQRRKRMDKPGGTLEYGRMAGQREHQKQE